MIELFLLVVHREIPKALFEQLSAAGGILVGPVATAEGQYLRKICSSKGEITETVGLTCEVCAACWREWLRRRRRITTVSRDLTPL